MNHVSGIIRTYLINEYGLSENLTDHEPLFSNGLLDSIDILSLLSFIEREFKIKFNPFDVGMESFDSIELICNTISRMRG